MNPIIQDLTPSGHGHLRLWHQAEAGACSRPIVANRLSAITLSEFEYGVEKSRRPSQNRLALADFIAPFEVLPYDRTASECYGKIRAQLEMTGQPIGALDLLIAAHAVAHSLVLATNNERGFGRVPSLEIENWAAET